MSTREEILAHQAEEQAYWDSVVRQHDEAERFHASQQIKLQSTCRSEVTSRPLASFRWPDQDMDPSTDFTIPVRYVIAEG